MERFDQRGSDLFGNGTRPQKSLETSTSTWYNDSDIDYGDVFGGPPRRYSMPEVRMRYSFREPLEEVSDDNSETNSTTFDPWFGLIEKSVFGEECVNRKRHVNNDFFDDIFKGDVNCSSPRKSCYQGSNPGSRILSPSRPFLLKAEPFSTSLPAQFSLPSGLTKEKVSHGLASGDAIAKKNEDVLSYVKSSPVLSEASFSKFLNRAMRGKHDSRGSQYCQSPLSSQASVGNLECLDGYDVSNNNKDGTNKKNGEDIESPIDGSQFHFSIHKWAHGEVPLLISLREGKTTQVEEKSGHSSFRSTRIESLKVEIKKADETSNQERIGSEEVAKGANLDIFDLEIDNAVEHHAVDVQSSLNYYLNEKTQRSQNVDKHNNVKSPCPVKHQPEPEMKPLGAVSSEKVDEQGNRKERAQRGSEGKKGAKSANFSNEEKKSDARKKSSKTTMVGKNSAPGSPRTSGDIPHKSAVKGKMDENPMKDEVKQPSSPKISNHSNSRYTEQKEASFFTESFHFTVTDVSSETYFRESFSVEELSNDQDIDLQPSGDPDYIKVSDAKIKQWSQGRKGNIRSLLSTLQLVLWPESGLRPVPLVDIIEGSSVKKAYQRALLCLHPDKLQQKGMAAHQKYIAEKVFDILQDAWDNFNSLGAI